MIEEIFAQITPEGHLSLSSFEIGHELFQQIVSNPDIKDLQINYAELTDKDFIFLLLNNKNIKRLDLQGNHITVERIKYIPGHSVLEYLNLSDQAPQINAEYCQYFNTTHLKELDLATNNVGDKGCEGLAKNENLKIINLFNNNISPVGVAFFKDSGREVNLVDNPLLRDEKELSEMTARELIFSKREKHGILDEVLKDRE